MIAIIDVYLDNPTSDGGWFGKKVVTKDGATMIPMDVYDEFMILVELLNKPKFGHAPYTLEMPLSAKICYKIAGNYHKNIQDHACIVYDVLARHLATCIL